MKLPTLTLNYYLTPIGNLNKAEMAIYLSLNHEKYIWRTLNSLKIESLNANIKEKEFENALHKLYKQNNIKKFIRSNDFIDIYALTLRLHKNIQNMPKFDEDDDIGGCLTHIIPIYSHDVEK